MASVHQICFEGEPDPRSGQRIAIAVCDDDSGKRCKISATNGVNALAPVTPSNAQPLALRPPAPGAARTVAYFPFRNDMQVRFDHASGVPRECWMAAADTRRAAGALASFSTDVSGLATTGVWQLRATEGVGGPRPPAGFRVVGGGTVVADPWSWIRRSSPEPWWLPESWVSAGEQESGAPAAEVTAYVVGLRIAHLSDTDLANWGASVLPSPAKAPAATVATDWAQAPLQPGFVEPAQAVVGGGLWGYLPNHAFHASASRPANSLGSLLCTMRVPRPASCPRPQPLGWHAETKHPVGAVAAEVFTAVSLLPRDLTLTHPRTGVTTHWELRSTAVEADSAPSTRPEALATGLRGTYALTDAGAAADWRSPTGNNPFKPSVLLSGIEPRADLGGARATAQAGSWGAAATTVTAYAVGLKLVPAGTPPDAVPPPERVRTGDFCLVDGRLESYEMCKQPSKLVSPAMLCEMEPGLRELGYCR